VKYLLAWERAVKVNQRYSSCTLKDMEAIKMLLTETLK